MKNLGHNSVAQEFGLILGSKKGVSLVELLISMVVAMVIIALVSDTFVTIITYSGRETKVSEAQMEANVNLELFRMDLESIGYGLPWVYPGSLSGYQEAQSGSVCGGAGVDPASLNGSNSSPPIAVAGANNRCVNQSDYLVIRCMNVARNSSSDKWTYVTMDGIKEWGKDDLLEGDNIVLIQPKAGETMVRRLLVVGNAFTTQYPPDNSWWPGQDQERYVVYGLDPDTTPSVPFNRADYYISTSSVPSECATGTGVLRKAVFSHNTHGFPTGNLYPLLDCVADFQVIFGFDMNEDGVVGTYSNPEGTSISTEEGSSVGAVQASMADPELLRRRFKEIRAYILTQEGKREPKYNYPFTTVTVGEFGLGKTFDLTQITNYNNYRWRVITISAKPRNVAQ